MTRIIEFFVLNRVWSNVLLFSVLIFGGIFYLGITYSFFPEVEPNIITIQVVYPGASPEEMEEGIVLKIEENLDGLEGVERVTSTSRENTGTVVVEITKEATLNIVLQDVKNAVDRINSFPIGAEKPIIFAQKFRSRALSIVLYGETDLFNLKYWAEIMRDRLVATPEISQVKIEGLPNLEFSIEVSETDLRRFKLSFSEIAAAVGAENINLSGGKFDTDDEEILIRAYARNYYAPELENLAIRGNDDGTIIYLKDVARIHERWEDVPDRSYYNGHATAILVIDKTEEEDILAVANKAKQLVEEFNDSHSQLQASVLDDRTIPLRQRLALLISNGFLGLLMVVITLGFFLNFRLSLWVSVGIPFSFAGMFIIASMVGLTINVISLFGMIVVVGILVDDAIVVGENIYAHYERGVPAAKAAVIGTKEMIGPVTTSVLTTIVAFTPFFFLDGIMGRFIWHMAVVVIATLAFSLVEAFFILPGHLAHSKGLHPHKDDSPLRKKIDRIIAYLTERIYAPTLRFAMDHKWTILVTPIAAFMITIGLLRGGFIGMTIFPFIDGDAFPVNLTLVPGRQEADTDSLLAMIERKAWEVNEQIKSERADGKDVIRAIKRDIGRNDLGEQGSHSGMLLLQLLDGEQRKMDSPIIASMLREAVGPLPEVQKFTYGRVGHFGKPVSISLLGTDLDQLKHARDLLIARLEEFPTLKDVLDSEQEGRREIDIKLKPRAYALGLTLRDVAGQVRQGFFGQEIQRIQRDRDEIRVWVRYRPEDRASLGFLDRMRIRTPDGSEYPFSELAGYTVDRGLISINRLENQREIKVEASLTEFEIDLPPILDEIKADILPDILSQTEGVRASFEGQSRQQVKMVSSMKGAFTVAFIVMFLLIILVFRSYLQALLIFSIIPVGALGAVWGHGIMGIQLNMLSTYGFIALTGIIINDSIVFVDKINRNLKTGMLVRDAVYDAGISRLRPILLTTMTTALGLAPLIAETSRQAQFLVPMAVAVAFGLAFGTFVLLLIVPTGFLAMNRLRYFWATVVQHREATRESVEPAVREMAELEKTPTWIKEYAAAMMIRINATMIRINATMVRIIASLSLLFLPLFSMSAQEADSPEESGETQETLQAREAQAQQETPQSPVTLSAEDAIAIGLRNNFNIRIARNEAELASNSTTFGTANFLPTLNLTGGISMADSKQETNSPFSFGDSQSNGGDAKLSLNWTLFDGFRMFVDNARYLELEKLGEYRSRQIIESTVVNILRSYFDLVQQEELREVAENTMRTSLTRLEKEEVRKEIGGASSTDYLNAKVSYNNDRTMVLNQELKVAIAGQNLNMLLGRSADTPVAVTSTFDIPTLETGLDELLERAYERNSTLLTAQQSSIVAEQNVDLATSVFWPRVGLFANYGIADKTVSSSSPRFTEDISTQSQDGMVGLSLSFNLFNGLRDNTKRQNAQIEAMNAQLVLEDGRIRLAGLVREKHLTFKQRVQIVALEEQNVQAAEQNLELERDRYEMGSSGSLEFRDAQVKLARAQTTLIVARYQARITWLEIQQLIGAIKLN